jgi:hypothetical protein
MADAARVLEDALTLSCRERARIALVHSLGADDDDDAPGDEWKAAWSAEIDRRVREIDDGTAQLLDGDAVLADARTWLDAQRP